MRRRTVSVLLVTALAGTASPAFADHTDPGGTAPVLPQPSAGAVEEGEGDFELIANLGPMQGTDLEFFSRDGVQYVAGGTLGQGFSPVPEQTPGFVGQRIVSLTDATGAVLEEPEIVADHYSASCALELSSSATGLQHDVQAVPLEQTELLIDTTDAVGRCHDQGGGGLEIIDVSGLGTEGFEPREIGLVRLNGLSHTVTADRDRPGILYNNGADFGPAGDPEDVKAMTWTDIVDVRSCMDLGDMSLEDKRAACRPVVTRLDYDSALSSKVLPDETLTEPANCHDITYSDDRLYCAGLNASFVMDISGVFDADGDVRGEALPCTEAEATLTDAVVTDCALGPDATGGPVATPLPGSRNPTAAESVEAYEAIGSPSAEGAEVVTVVNHPGRACPDPGTTTCNTNLAVPSDEGVAVSHENDPALGGDFMFVTDERGGGVLPPGATCAPGLDNPVGNGGMHVFDISDPAAPVPATTADGSNAVYIGGSPTPAPTFCTIHVIEQIPGEQRVVAAYYDGGTEIVDYFIAPDGTWSFRETASFRLPGANTWASEVFKVEDNGNGTNTYFFTSNSFALGEGTARGLDVFSWTGPANPPGTQDPALPPADGGPDDGTGGGTDGGDGGGTDGGSTGGTGSGSTSTASGRSLPATGADVALLLLAATMLPLAFGLRVLRRRLAPQDQ